MAENGHIDLEKLPNTRDLGGIETQDGRHIKPRHLLRSGTLNQANDSDIAILLDEYELHTVVDLRTKEERENKPDPFDKLRGVSFIDLPLINSRTAGITRESQESFLEKIERVAQNPIEAMTEVYPRMLLDPTSQKNLHLFFETLLKQTEGAVLWHCSVGKDRVGVTTALLLYVLGVSREAVVDDYLATNKFMHSSTQEILDAFSAFPLPDRIKDGIHVFNSADIRFFDAGFDAVNDKYGSIENYVRDVLEVSSEMREALRDKYLTAAV